MRVAVNAGLWLGDPDIDATTRLSAPVTATGYGRAENFFVAAGAWAPFNSQNTALDRRALPAYFLSPGVGRYDDILASFIVKRIADHLGEGICYGHPLVRQQRNPHDLFSDLEREIMGMRITDDFIAALEQATLPASGWRDCAAELCAQAQAAMRDKSLPESHQASLAGFFAGYRLWLDLPVW